MLIEWIDCDCLGTVQNNEEASQLTKTLMTSYVGSTLGSTVVPNNYLLGWNTLYVFTRSKIKPTSIAEKVRKGQFSTMFVFGVLLDFV